MKRLLLATLLPLLALSAAATERDDALQPSGRFSVYGHGAAATPPMGFNPWNAFRTEVDQARIESVIDTIQQRGLQQAGYRYINIDDGWWLKRGADGKIEIRTAMFPIAKQANGDTSFRAWTDALHARGFKAGLYTDVGRNACSQAFDRHSPNLPVGNVAQREIGLQGFEASDLKTMFQDWGFDYLKVDACGLADFGAGSEPVVESGHRVLRPLIVRDDAQRTDADAVETQYARVGRLLADLNPDNDYVLAICPWGQAGVRNWGGDHGHLWRTSPDIEPTWASMLHNFDSASRRELYAGPGRWNDPDMLAIGLGDFDAKHLTEARTHFSLWAILSAPLLMGFDLTRAPASLIELLRNPEVIAVNQDPAGNQGRLVVETGQVQVLVKPLSTRGAKAVVLFNRGDTPATAQVDAAQLKLRADAPLQARDLWQHRDLPAHAGPLRFALAPHASMMLRVQGTPALAEGEPLSDMTGRIHVAVDGVQGYSTDLAGIAGTPRTDVAPDGSPLRIAGTTYRDGIGIHADSRLEVRAGGDFSRFTTQVGLQDTAKPVAGDVVFRVYGDGQLLHETTPLHQSDAATQLTVPVAGVQVIELVAAVADTSAVAKTPTPVVAWANAILQ
ncbi:Alpha galactosidase A [Pseudoxanthomonas sp. GM95]|uniref:NPCBM/NEW2 domain-containing protein n=1 Tax=Pseudoxanthomonas sp. GM95 TaxID=1881043 RepID=UPI0008D5846D|nr:NPCBM/NEW2 domain-containing protein [Pseudoxanthomonas sp. GM95]SEM14749.1 Alpha galactosidase A [Pseudoxanthomonas sp. GM95]